VGWLSGRSLRFGRSAEIRGARYLRRLGYRLLACPFVSRDGEIDIVADDGGCLVFVEVKARRDRDSSPEDAVNRRKRERIVRAARAYRRRYREGVQYRYDVLAVRGDDQGGLEFELFRDAFR